MSSLEELFCHVDDFVKPLKRYGKVSYWATT